MVFTMLSDPAVSTLLTPDLLMLDLLALDLLALNLLSLLDACPDLLALRETCSNLLIKSTEIYSNCLNLFNLLKTWNLL